MSTLSHFDPNTPAAVSVTDKAQAHFAKQLRANEQLVGIRLSVVKSGCSGFKYHIEGTQTHHLDDQVVLLNDGVQLFIDQAAKPYLNGISIDFVREGLNQQIVFNNPNAKDLCGCGESFSV